MKILHVISQRPEATGSGYTLQNIMRQAHASGYHNGLVAAIGSGEAQPELSNIHPKDIFFLGFPGPECDFHIPGMSDVMPYRSSRFGLLSEDQVRAYLNAFRHIIERAIDGFRPDIIHSHHLWLVSSIVREVSPSLPMVTSCHSTDLRQYQLCPQFRDLVRHQCSKIDRVLALSRQQAKAITDTLGIGASQIDIVGGGYDNTLFSGEPRVGGQPVQLLYAGKLSFAKGVDWLLRVVQGLGDDIHLHLAGSGTGEEEKRCRELARACGKKVTLHGRIHQVALAELMSQCDIFLLPSFYEGLPLVLLEALASGCRLLTTDLPGCRELLQGAGPNLARMIPLPKNLHVDRPHSSDWDRLDMLLKENIIAMCDLVRNEPVPSGQEINALTSAMTWPKVFSRIETAYKRATSQ